jgi:RNA polymerase sigma-70 factor (ECF subfamily)
VLTLQQPPLYETYRPLLLALAYRMLGSRSDAEDVVQEVFTQYFQLDQDKIEHAKSYLIRMTTNRCLNLQGSAYKRKESYVGEWLPEPSVLYDDGASHDPAFLWDKNETVTYAMLVMLEHLGPVERAVFLLRETLSYEYAEIGDILGKSEAACRKINSRAKQKLHADKPAPAFNHERAGALAQAFIKAAETGNTETLLSILTEDAVLLSDGGGKARSAILPITGRRRILAFFAGLHRKGTFENGFLPAVVNGQAGMVLLSERSPHMILTFRWDKKGEKIEAVYIVVNPEKLKHVTKRNAILS